MEPYSYVGNNPIRYIDPTGMAKDDIIDIDINTGSIKITPTDSPDVVRLIDSKNNKVVIDQYTYGKDGSFINDVTVKGYDSITESPIITYDFKDSVKANQFYKFVAKSDVEYAFFEICIGDPHKHQTTVMTNGGKISVKGTSQIQKIMDQHPNSKLLQFSHSHPGSLDKYNFKPSGFDEFLKPTNKPGDRQSYIDLKQKYGNRIPNYFDLYLAADPNRKTMFNNKEVIIKK